MVSDHVIIIITPVLLHVMDSESLNSLVDDDVCEICFIHGILVECDVCKGSWHVDCHPIKITKRELDSNDEWCCHRCRVDKVTPSKTLTIYGHLRGCLGRDRPNVLRACCTEKNQDGSACASQVSKQSCLWTVSKSRTPHGRCSRHYVEFCLKNGHNSDLSNCANRVCDSLRVNMKKRMEITPSNIQHIISLPHLYVDRDNSNSLRPTNHISERKILELSNERKALTGELSERRATLECHHADLSNKFLLSMHGDLHSHDGDDDQFDEEPNSDDRHFIDSEDNSSNHSDSCENSGDDDNESSSDSEIEIVINKSHSIDDDISDAMDIDTETSIIPRVNMQMIRLKRKCDDNDSNFNKLFDGAIRPTKKHKK